MRLLCPKLILNYRKLQFYLLIFFQIQTAKQAIHWLLNMMYLEFTSAIQYTKQFRIIRNVLAYIWTGSNTTTYKRHVVGFIKKNIIKILLFVQQ